MHHVKDMFGPYDIYEDSSCTSYPYESELCVDNFPDDHDCGRTTLKKCDKCNSSQRCKHSKEYDYSRCYHINGKCPSCKEHICHCRWSATGHYILNSQEFLDEMGMSYINDGCYYCGGHNCCC